MTFKTRLMLAAAVVALPMISACSESPTGPTSEAKIRRDGGDSTSLAGCGDSVPWGIAPCLIK